MSDLPSSAPAEAFDPRALRNALGRFATGITVITAIHPDGQPIGLTANSFSAVSLDPALVLWCLDKKSINLAAFQAASHHAINILSAHQEDISNRFATWPVDRFAGLAWHAGIGGAPCLPDCLAVFEVANQTCHDAGDHLIFVGRIERFTTPSDAPPLLFHAGQYRKLQDC